MFYNCDSQFSRSASQLQCPMQQMSLGAVGEWKYVANLLQFGLARTRRRDGDFIYYRGYWWVAITFQLARKEYHDEMAKID